MKVFNVFNSFDGYFIHCGNTNTIVGKVLNTKLRPWTSIASLYAECDALNQGLASMVEFGEGE